MLAQSETGGAAAGEREPLHFEKGSNVLVKSGVVPELLDQVEKNVRREGLQFLPHKIDIVVDGEMLGGVTELAERGHDVRLGFPILRFHFLAEILIEGGRACTVEQHENFEFLFHGSLFGALEFSSEKIIHHQRRDESGDAKILLRIIIEHMQPKLIAAAGEPREELVDTELFLVCPLANRIQ